jgi:hypothetical protein
MCTKFKCLEVQRALAGTSHVACSTARYGATMRLLAAALLMVFSGMWTGCTPMFIGRTDVSVTRPPSSKERQLQPVKPTASVLARATALPPQKLYPWSPPWSEAIPLQSEIESAVRKATENSRLFKSFSLGPDADADFVIEVDAATQARPLGLGRVSYLVLHLLSFTVLPFPKSTDVVLTVTVTRRDGTAHRTYRLEGSITQVNEMLFIFLPVGWVLTPERAARHVFEELVAALYRQIQADDLLTVQGPRGPEGVTHR